MSKKIRDINMNIRKIMKMTLKDAMDNVIDISEYIVRSLESKKIVWENKYEFTVVSKFSNKTPIYEKHLVARKWNHIIDVTITFTKKHKIATVIYRRLDYPKSVERTQNTKKNTMLQPITGEFRKNEQIPLNAILDVIFSYVTQCNLNKEKSEEMIAIDKKHREQIARCKSIQDTPIRKSKAPVKKAENVADQKSEHPSTHNPVNIKAPISIKNPEPAIISHKEPSAVSGLAVNVGYVRPFIQEHENIIQVKKSINDDFHVLFEKSLEYNHFQMTGFEKMKTKKIILWITSMFRNRIANAKSIDINKNDMLKSCGHIKEVLDMPEHIKAAIFMNKQPGISEITKYIISDGACFNHENGQYVNAMILLNERMQINAIIYAASVDGKTSGRHEHMAMYVMRYLLDKKLSRSIELLWMTDISQNAADNYANKLINDISCITFNKVDPTTKDSFIGIIISGICDKLCSMKIKDKAARKILVT